MSYSRASITDYSDPGGSGTIIIGNIHPPSKTAFSFERIFQEEYLAAMEKLGIHKNDCNLYAATRIAFFRRDERIKFWIDGWDYSLPTYKPYSIKIRALVPGDLYQKALRDNKVMDDIFKTLEEAVGKTLAKCKI